MQFKDFLQWVRSSGERYVVLDADGEPEFVIEPFQQKNPSTGSGREKSTVEKINETLAAVAENEREEIVVWDAMAETTLGGAKTPGVDSTPGVDASQAHSNDEPTFQFETIDE